MQPKSQINALTNDLRNFMNIIRVGYLKQGEKNISSSLIQIKDVVEIILNIKLYLLKPEKKLMEPGGSLWPRIFKNYILLFECK